MAKYDQYKIISVPTGDYVKYERELSVLFEDGDDVAQVLIDTDLILAAEVAGDGMPIDEQLLALSQSDFRGLIRKVWIEQMSTMGNGKYDYANLLRSDVNVAQDTPN